MISCSCKNKTVKHLEIWSAHVMISSDFNALTIKSSPVNSHMLNNVWGCNARALMFKPLLRQ